MINSVHHYIFFQLIYNPNAKKPLFEGLFDLKLLRLVGSVGKAISFYFGQLAQLICCKKRIIHFKSLVFGSF